MGHYDCTFGTWMKAKPIKTVKTETYNACTKATCDNHKRDMKDINFCPKCGSAVREYARKVNDKIQLADFVYPEEGDAMKCFENLNCWDDNDVLTDGGFRKQVDLEGGKQYQPWAKDGDGIKSVIDPQAEINKFKKTYSKAIDVLTKAGFELSFEWGAFTTYD